MELDMAKSAFFPRYEYDFSQNSLLKKIQHASINRQIKTRLGRQIWRMLFKECRYEVDSDLITIAAPNLRVADIITQRYRMLLEKLFNTQIRVENHHGLY